MKRQVVALTSTDRLRTGPRQAKAHTGVPADHFVPAPKSISPAKALRLVRAEIARRRRS